MAEFTTVPNVYSLYPRVGSISSVNSSAVNFYINQAENEMKGYLINNYTLPFSSTPPILETIASEYALVKILERFFTQEIGSENKWVEERKKTVFNYFKQLNDGTIGLFTSSGEIIPWNAGDTIFSNTMNYQPTFTMLNPTLQVIDTERLDDEFDEWQDQDYNPYY